MANGLYSALYSDWRGFGQNPSVVMQTPNTRTYAHLHRVFIGSGYLDAVYFYTFYICLFQALFGAHNTTKNYCQWLMAIVY